MIDLTESLEENFKDILFKYPSIKYALIISCARQGSFWDLHCIAINMDLRLSTLKKLNEIHKNKFQSLLMLHNIKEEDLDMIDKEFSQLARYSYKRLNSGEVFKFHYKRADYE